MFLYKSIKILRKPLNYIELPMNYLELPVELLELPKFHTFGSSVADIKEAQARSSKVPLGTWADQVAFS